MTRKKTRLLLALGVIGCLVGGVWLLRCQAGLTEVERTAWARQLPHVAQQTAAAVILAGSAALTASGLYLRAGSLPPLRNAPPRTKRAPRPAAANTYGERPSIAPSRYLRELKTMRDEELITEEEFARKKQDLLDHLTP